MSSSHEKADDCAVVEITLAPSVYAELLERLDRFVYQRDTYADRNWLKRFCGSLRRAG